MKLLTSSLLLSTVLLLAACGGGSSDDVVNPPVTQPGTSNPSDPDPAQPGDAQPDPDPDPDPGAGNPPSPPPTDLPPLPNGPYVIDYYGDSTIWGWATGTNGAQVDTPAPVAFANALSLDAGEEVRNEGVSGSTACELLEGTDGRHPDWRTQMQSSGAAYVIVNHGINDQNDYGVERYRRCLEDLVVIARENGKHVILETPNPVSGADLQPYVDAMRAVAADMQPTVPLIDQHAYLMDYLDGEDPGQIAPDGVHPSQETYILKGQYAADVFSGMFPR